MGEEVDVHVVRETAMEEGQRKTHHNVGRLERLTSCLKRKRMR